MNLQVKIFHFLLHREKFVSKKLPEEMDIMMKDIIHAVNFIKSRSFNNWILSQMCSDISYNYTHSFHHSELRQLLQGNDLQQLVALCSEVKTCLEKSSLGSKVLRYKVNITTSLPSRYIFQNQ